MDISIRRSVNIFIHRMKSKIGLKRIIMIILLVMLMQIMVSLIVMFLFNIEDKFFLKNMRIVLPQQSFIQNNHKKIEPISLYSFKPSTVPPSKWTMIDHSLHIYSAFWDHINGTSFARIFGIMRYSEDMTESPHYKFTGIVKHHLLNHTCYLWYKNQDKAIKGRLKARIIEEAKLIFVGTTFGCYLPENLSETNLKNKHLPYAVSLKPNRSKNYPDKLIYIQILSRKDDKKLATAVCVRPLFGPYGDGQSLVQFIAYYHSVLGVSIFHLYDMALTPGVMNLLANINNEGFKINIHSWNIPTGNVSELWDYGTLVALNDCVYRTISYAKYTIIVDIDEFIVPRDPFKSISQVYDAVLARKHGIDGDALLILNAFFCFEFPGNFKIANRANKSETEVFLWPIFQMLTREYRPWSDYRNKMVIKPEHVTAIGHHKVWKFASAFDNKNHASPFSIVSLNHYRECKGIRYGLKQNGMEVLRSKTIKDKAMLRFKAAVRNSSFVNSHIQKYL